jgi:hypothetical protein
VSDLQDPTGRQTYKTRVVAGDRNPRWQEQFMFPLPAPGAARDAPSVMVVVLDYDRGCGGERERERREIGGGKKEWGGRLLTRTSVMLVVLDYERGLSGGKCEVRGERRPKSSDVREQ